MHKTYLQAVVLLFLLFPFPLAAKEPMQVTFISPTDKGEVFWDNVVAFMEAAADDLGIELKVRYNPSSNRFGEKDIAVDVLTSNDKPDYLITQIKRNNLSVILDLAEQARVSYFTINTAVPEKERAKVGKPRGKYKFWIGQMVPDDFQAGYDLANFLITQAQAKNLAGMGASLQMLGISGGQDSSAALERNQGLLKAVEEHASVNLKQLVFSQWLQEDAYRLTKRLLGRHPETTIVWTASDLIALGVTQASKEKGKTPGKEILTAGIDWTGEGVKAVENGALSATFGGHFMEGGWALVLLYDYHHGVDFADDLGIEIRTRFESITKANVDRYKSLLIDENYEDIDFRGFSKVYNKQLKRYNFDIKKVISSQ